MLVAITGSLVYKTAVFLVPQLFQRLGKAPGQMYSKKLVPKNRLS